MYKVLSSLSVITIVSGCFALDRLDGVAPGSVVGRAVTADGEPLAATIAVEDSGDVRTAGADGGFVIAGLTAGAHALRFVDDTDGDGVADRGAMRAVQITSGAFDVDGNPALSSVLLGDVELVGTARLQGTVTADGVVVAGATVVVERTFADLGIADANEAGRHFAVDAAVDSGADGTWSAEGLVAGRARVWAVAPDGRASAVIEVVAGEDDDVALELLETSAARNLQVAASGADAGRGVLVQLFAAGDLDGTVLHSESLTTSAQLLFAAPVGVYDMRATVISDEAREPLTATLLNRPVPPLDANELAADASVVRLGTLQFGPVDPCASITISDDAGFGAAADCEEIGRLTISGPAITALTSTQLPGLERVRSFVVQATVLSAIELDSLREADEVLIVDNANLASVSFGFERIGAFTLKNNADATLVESVQLSFGAPTTIGDLVLADNGATVSASDTIVVTGLAALERFGSITVSDSASTPQALYEFAAFSAVDGCGDVVVDNAFVDFGDVGFGAQRCGRAVVRGNGGSSFLPWAGVKTLRGLEISGNGASSLEGLEAIEVVEENFVVEDSFLSIFDALASLRAIGALRYRGSSSPFGGLPALEVVGSVTLTGPFTQVAAQAFASVKQVGSIVIEDTILGAFSLPVTLAFPALTSPVDDVIVRRVALDTAMFIPVFQLGVVGDEQGAQGWSFSDVQSHPDQVLATPAPPSIPSPTPARIELRGVVVDTASVIGLESLAERTLARLVVVDSDNIELVLPTSFAVTDEVRLSNSDGVCLEQGGAAGVEAALRAALEAIPPVFVVDNVCTQA